MRLVRRRWLAASALVAVVAVGAAACEASVDVTDDGIQGEIDIDDEQGE